MTVEEMKLVDELTAAIEEGLQGDGTHIGITDSELILKALRSLAAAASLPAGAMPIEMGEAA